MKTPVQISRPNEIPRERDPRRMSAEPGDRLIPERRGLDRFQRDGNERAHSKRTGHGRASRRPKRRSGSRVLQNAFLGIAALLLIYEIVQTLEMSSPGMVSLPWAAPKFSANFPANFPGAGASRFGSRVSQTRNSEIAAAYRGELSQRKRLLEDEQSSPGGWVSKPKASSSLAVYSWFEQAAQAVSGVLSDAYVDTADAASSAFKEAARYAAAIDISNGLVHLPRLVESGANDTAANSTALGASMSENATAGAAWSSASWAALTALPAYLKAVAMHAAPKLTSEEALAQREERGSIFSSRRKGEWMGCTRAYHLVCKGVYRAIKQVNAVTVVDAACTANARWMPLVLEHLRKEFRIIQLTCIDQDASGIEYVRAAYSDLENVKFKIMNPFREKFKNETDLVIGVKLLDKQNMINTMKFFKNVHNSGAVKNVVFENYPNSKNRIDLGSTKKTVRFNGFAPPFMFGNPVYRYQNADEQPTTEMVEILAMEAPELFANMETPHMADLEDPKKRKRRVEPV